MDTIGKTYWSSSKYVKDFITQFGFPDRAEIRKTFSTKLDAKNWETKVLIRINAANDKRWLNRGNNGSFKNVIMTEDIKKSISKAHLGKKLGKVYNDGIKEIRVKETENVPSGFVRGNIQTEKRKQHYKKLNSQSLEERKLSAAKCAAKTTGLKRTEETKHKMSIAAQGKPKPWNYGENNPAKREEVRLKISIARKGKSMPPMSVEAKRKISLATKGRKHSEKTKRKIGLKHRGKVLSLETRKKISESRRGIVVSQETRRKMSEAHKKRWKQKNEKKSSI